MSTEYEAFSGGGGGTLPIAADFGKPQSEARHWFEPLLVVTIMVASLYFNRNRSASRKAPTSSPQLNHDQREKDHDPECFGPRNLSSRILQKFPFLVEMFYWLLNYVAYAATTQIGTFFYSLGNGNHQVTKIAQDHGIAILALEHSTVASWFFPVTEVEFQHFFLGGHGCLLTFLNQIYSLVHIPGTVAFLSWSYYAAPSHDVFATIRRTMCLGNFAAFAVFCIFPCMPPRLLPASFGFVDTVRQGNAESIWASASSVNQLAAMPSLHFTYAFIIGSTFIYLSGIPQAAFQGWRRFPAPGSTKTCLYVAIGVLYPLLVLTVIVATANHYWLDAMVSTCTVGFAFLCNRVWLLLLPIEKMMLRVLRLRKPDPPMRTSQRGRLRDKDPPPLLLEHV